MICGCGAGAGTVRGPNLPQIQVQLLKARRLFCTRNGCRGTGNTASPAGALWLLFGGVQLH